MRSPFEVVLYLLDDQPHYRPTRAGESSEFAGLILQALRDEGYSFMRKMTPEEEAADQEWYD